MKNDPEFYYFEDHLSKQTTINSPAYNGGTSKENNTKRTSHYIRNEEGKGISRSDLGLDQTARNHSRESPNDTPIVHVTVNGGKRFI